MRRLETGFWILDTGYSIFDLRGSMNLWMYADDGYLMLYIGLLILDFGFDTGY